jgi:hypothetical protein
MENTETSNIKTETVTEEHIKTSIIVPVSEQDAKVIKAYAEMVKIDAGTISNKIMHGALKSLKDRLNGLPFTNLQEILEKYNDEQMS